MRIYKIKFPINIAHGSLSEKEKNIQRMNSEIFNNLIKLYENTDKIPIRKIEHEYRKSLPYQLYLRIQKLNDAESKKLGGGLFTFFSDNIIRFYKMKLPAINNNLSWRNLPTLMHESTHFLERATNPKKNNTIIQLTKRFKNIKNIIEFYSENLYKTNNSAKCDNIDLQLIKHSLKKLVKNYNNEEKLAILKYYKEGLLSEIIAFKEESKYIKEINSNQTQISNISREPLKTIKTLKLYKKVEMINDMIFKVISNERKKIKQRS